jgi:hypothetical protein
MSVITRDVERIAVPTVEEIFARLIPQRRPVVIEGFLRGAALDGLATLAEARSAIGGVEVELCEEFAAWSLRHGGAPDLRPRSRSTAGAYLDLLEAEPRTALMCTEFPTPPALLEGLGEWPRQLARGEELTSYSFIGGRGHHAHLHCDGDLRNVLLVQVFGHKRAVLIPPDASPLLMPVGNFAGVFVDRLDDGQRDAFVALTGGWRAEIGPGDALFMPPALWHFLDYPDTGMSINLRFGRSAANARMAGRFHMHDGWQRLGWHFADHHVPTAEEEQGLERLLALGGPVAVEAREHGAEIERRTRDLADTWCGPARSPAFLAEAGRLGEAWARHECERLYRRAQPSLALSLTGWETVR